MNTAKHLGPVLAALALALAVPAVYAQSDLYTATVPERGDGATARNQAIADALEVVLQKLSGRRDLAGRPGLDAARAAAPGQVQQFRYRRSEVADEEGAREIWVRFDPAAVQRTLQELGLPVWNTSRPRTLVWIALERNGRRELFSPEGLPTLLQALRGQAAARGLPLQVPLMDLEDRTRLDVGDLWNAFEGPIRAASRRYAHDSVLVGRLRQVGRGDWRSTWTLLLPEAEPFRIDGGGASLAQVARDGIDRATDRMAARFAPVDAGDGPSALALRISGVRDLRAYADVLQALQEQQAVSGLSVRYATDDRIQLDLRVVGGVENLRRGLTLDPRFEPEMTQFAPVFPASTPPPGQPAGTDVPGDPPGDSGWDRGDAGAAEPAPEPDFDIAYRWSG